MVLRITAKGVGGQIDATHIEGFEKIEAIKGRGKIKRIGKEKRTRRIK